MPSVEGPLPEGLKLAGLTTAALGFPDEQRKARAKELVLDDARIFHAKRLANSDPEVALRLANSVKDPARRAETLLAVAQGKLKETNPTEANRVIDEFGSESEKTKTKGSGERLAILVALARAQAGRNDAGLWDTLNRGLELAEELFQQDTKTGRARRIGYVITSDWGLWPGYTAAGFKEALELMKLGAEKQPANTLDWLAQQRDPALQSYLLISAAEGLWNVHKTVPSAQAAAEEGTPAR
jgi:hypothetical protein